MTPTERQRLSDRVANRNAGRALAETVMELIGDVHPDVLACCIETLQQRVTPPERQPEKTPRQIRQEKMEAGRFVLKFGEFKHIPICEIPISYLQWLNDSSREVHEAISRYLQ